MLYVARTVRHPDSVRATVNSVVGILIAAVPTAVPTVVVAALAYCTVHLQRSHIELLVHAKIKTIADVEVVCFDKTGTLTGTTVNALSWPFALRLSPCAFCLLPLANMCYWANVGCLAAPAACLLTEALGQDIISAFVAVVRHCTVAAVH